MHDDNRPLLPRDSRLLPAGEHRPLASVSDDDLLKRLAEILAQSRHVETELVAHIGEVDARRLYAREAFPSMFAYCTKALHLSEAEAYLRIAAARASREHPVLLEMLGDGRLHLSAIALLAPHLTAENRDALLGRATHRSKRQVEELIAEVAPREDAPALMRKLPERAMAMPAFATSSASAAAASTFRAAPLGPADPLACLDATPSGMGRTVTLALPTGPTSRGTQPLGPPSIVQPLSAGRYKVQFTASAGLHEKLERLQALLRSRVPDGDLAAIIEMAVTEKLERLEARRFASTSRPRTRLSRANATPASRHIPAAVRRAVRERDGNRCRYVDGAGRRCEQRDRLEYHHVHPFGVGGDHRPVNLRLMCPAHNAHLAERDYGRKAMARFRGGGSAEASGLAGDGDG